MSRHPSYMLMLIFFLKVSAIQFVYRYSKQTNTLLQQNSKYCAKKGEPTNFICIFSKKLILYVCSTNAHTHARRNIEHIHIDLI